MNKANGLVTIRKRNASGQVEGFGCHGHGRGCHRNKTRRDKTPCDDCVKGRPRERFSQVLLRIARTK